MPVFLIELARNSNKVYANAIQSIVYEGSSENIPSGLMSELVHEMTIVCEKKKIIEHIS